MCNCGTKRNQLMHQQQTSLYTGKEIPETLPPGIEKSEVYFKYTGISGLTVRGGVSGKIYRFNHSMAVIAVDYRDAPGMYAVPMLQKIKAL